MSEGIPMPNTEKEVTKEDWENLKYFVQGEALHKIGQNQVSVEIYN